MAEKVSRNTLLILTVAAVMISVLSITLSMIALDKISVTSLAQQEQGTVKETGGIISVKVPAQPSEMGAQVTLQVVENNS